MRLRKCGVIGNLPEDLRIAKEPSKTTVKGMVDSVLPAGSEVLIRVHIGGHGLNIKERRGIEIDHGSRSLCRIWLEFSTQY